MLFFNDYGFDIKSQGKVSISLIKETKQKQK